MNFADKTNMMTTTQHHNLQQINAIATSLIAQINASCIGWNDVLIQLEKIIQLSTPSAETNSSPSTLH